MVRAKAHGGFLNSTLLAAAVLIMAVLMPALAVSQTSLGDQRVGTSSGSFLRVGVGARPVGMGGAYVAICDDIVACAWNPAGLILIDGYEFALTHTALPADIDYNHACYGMPIKKLVLDAFNHLLASIYLGVKGLVNVTNGMVEEKYAGLVI